MKITELKINKANPRFIRDEKFKLLKKSVQEFPAMMELRPIVIDTDGTILGGNMRYRALLDLGYKELPDTWVKRADQLTDAEKQRFIIEDNVGFGEWEFDMLANEWDAESLKDWGMDLPDDWNNDENESTEKYTQKVETPIYEAKNKKPEITELFNAERYKELIQEIENSTVTNDVKEMLKVAASRHIVFNYENMADFYAHSDKETQQLMENSALVIIDFNRAIELGYVKLRDEIAAQYGQEYGDDE